MTKLLGVAAMLAAALAFASSASADQPLTGTVVLGMHTTFPAGTLCSFDVRVDLDGTGSFSIFDNPPRNIQHYEESGTVTANGKTLLVNDHWNVTTTPTEQSIGGTSHPARGGAPHPRLRRGHRAPRRGVSRHPLPVRDGCRLPRTVSVCGRR